MYSLISSRSSIVFFVCITCLHASLSFAQEMDTTPPSLLQDEPAAVVTESGATDEGASSAIEGGQEEELPALSTIGPLIAFAGTFTGNALGLTLASSLFLGAFFGGIYAAEEIGGLNTTSDSRIFGALVTASLASVTWVVSLVAGTIVGTALWADDSGDYVASLYGLLAGQLIGTAGLLLAGALGSYATLQMTSHIPFLYRGKFNPSLQDHLSLGMMQAAAATGTIAFSTLSAPLGVLAAHVVKHMMNKDSGEESFEQVGVE